MGRCWQVEFMFLGSTWLTTTSPQFSAPQFTAGELEKERESPTSLVLRAFNLVLSIQLALMLFLALFSLYEQI
jgi:hypothetical protein